MGRLHLRRVGRCTADEGDGMRGWQGGPLVGRFERCQRAVWRDICSRSAAGPRWHDCRSLSSTPVPHSSSAAAAAAAAAPFSAAVESSSSTLPSDRLVGGGDPFARSRLVDHITCSVEAGKGGDGAVAFLREKFRAQGPPCGGNGGRGGHIYVRAAGGAATATTTTRRSHTAQRNNLMGIARQVRAPAGKRGQGKGMDGRNGDDIFLTVPIGTIVRQIEHRTPLSASLKAEDQDPDWVHYPGHDENNASRPEFIEAQKVLKEHLEDDKRSRRRLGQETTIWDVSLEHQENPILIAKGGAGGLGNPAFLTSANRSPKFATRGRPGESLTFELELRHLADIGLVGPPNVGKSTILRGLTRSQAKVGDWEFTTLEPNLGVLQQSDVASHNAGLVIADIPGLLPGAATHGLGLGHDFLRHVARARCLVFVVDLARLPLSSVSSPCGAVSQLTDTWAEVAQWQEMQMSRVPLRHEGDEEKKKVLVLANKADLVEEGPGRNVLGELQSTLSQLSQRSTFLSNAGEDSVVAISAKDRVNLDIVADRMRQLVL